MTSTLEDEWVVIYTPPPPKPTVYGPFETEEQARIFFETIKGLPGEVRPERRINDPAKADIPNLWPMELFEGLVP